MSDDTERHAQIEARAYTLWVESGMPEGRAEDFWHLAKAQIEDEERPEEGTPQPPGLDR
ncbi:hypothetical protein HMPREF9946_00895 [Acetobacteraceae bacterium AT-5844]|nr:hypothetical protein HMPREF9946_00895 [Acetobacteraceae bacterium AT-5844]